MDKTTDNVISLLIVAIIIVMWVKRECILKQLACGPCAASTKNGFQMNDGMQKTPNRGLASVFRPTPYNKRQ
jgi:hypothetical protein